MRARSSHRWKSTLVFRSRRRLDLARRPKKLHLGQAQKRGPAAGARARSVLSRLARHAAAELRQPGYAGGIDRRSGKDRRAMRRPALRYGHARPARGLRTDLGNPLGTVLADGHSRCKGSELLLRKAKCCRVWNGRFSSRVSTTPTTSGFTTGCATITPGRCASIFTPGWTTRTSWPASSKITTSPVPPPRFHRESTKPPPSSRSCRRDCGSSIRGNSKGAETNFAPSRSLPRTGYGPYSPTVL